MLLSIIEKFNKSSYSTQLPPIYNDKTRNIVPLRFVFCCTDSVVLLQRLSNYIDVNWVWFRQPVAGAVDGLLSLHYLSDACPVSDLVCAAIVNLPCNIVDGSDLQFLHGFDKNFG